MMVVGIDAYRYGWVAVSIDDKGHRNFETLRNIDEVLRFGARLILIDIPIGLPKSGDRGCDKAARLVLGAARSRVFLGVRRALLMPNHIQDYEAANRWGKADGKGVSRQMHSISPKIKQVDQIMTIDLQRTIRETHPELVFQRLNGGKWLPSKKLEGGRHKRRELLRASGFTDIDKWTESLWGTGAKTDDLFDACAAAVAALNPTRLEGASEFDEKGLRIEMWF